MVTLAFTPGMPALRIDTGDATADWDGADLRVTGAGTATADLPSAAAREASQRGVRGSGCPHAGHRTQRRLRAGLGKMPGHPAAAAGGKLEP